MKMKALILLLALLGSAVAQPAENWTAPVEARKGKLKVATYQARLVGDVLLIRVTHEPGWHTYALDNLERAKKKAGEPPLGIEKNTQLAVSGGLQVVSKWRQSPPKDLSQPDINWLTWGFEGTTFFAVNVERTSETEAVITINGQGCKATTCVMIDELEIKLQIQATPGEAAKIDLTQFVEEGDLSNLK